MSIRLAIVGVGHITRHYFEALFQVPEFTLVGLCDAAGRFPADCELDCFTDVDQLLARRQPEMVIIATPNDSHLCVAQQVMEAGAWAVLEKPVVLNAQQLEVLDGHPGRVSVALHAAFGKELQALTRLRREGLSLGRVLAIHSAFYDPYFTPAGLVDGAVSLSGSWLDSGINALSVWQRIFPEMQLNVTDAVFQESDECDDLQAGVDFILEDGIQALPASIHTNWCLGRNQKRSWIIGINEAGGYRLVLDHSAQAIFLQQEKQQLCLFREKEGISRLTQHYIGVFKDLLYQYRKGEDNWRQAHRLHEFLFSSLLFAQKNTGRS